MHVAQILLPPILQWQKKSYKNTHFIDLQIENEIHIHMS